MKELDKLDHIQKVDAPPFLLTRIQASIECIQEEVVKPRVAFSLIATSLAILVLNIMIVSNTEQSESNASSDAWMAIDNSIY